MAPSSDPTPDHIIERTRKVLGSFHTLPEVIVLSYAEVAWKVINYREPYKCTLCRCPSGCSCCDAKLCGCTMDYAINSLSPFDI